MDLARTTPLLIDLEAEPLAAYPALTRGLALVLRDSSEAEDVAQAAFARALEQRHQFSGGTPALGSARSGSAWRSTSCGGGDGRPCARDRMIRELDEAAEFFRSVDEELTFVTERWLARHGVGAEAIEAEMAAMRRMPDEG